MSLASGKVEMIDGKYHQNKFKLTRTVKCLIVRNNYTEYSSITPNVVHVEINWLNYIEVWHFLYLTSCVCSFVVCIFVGVGEAINPSEWRWSKHNRVIVSGGVFGEYLMTPSRNSVVVIDGNRRHVQCEWQDIAHGNIIVWVDPLHLWEQSHQIRIFSH